MFQNIHNWPLEHWHIELCSKCTLLCPRCSRQRVPEGLQNKDLSLDWFKENFTGLLYSNLKKITFCGDDGDTIYAKDLLPIIKWLRKENDQVQFVIVTNGSYNSFATDIYHHFYRVRVKSTSSGNHATFKVYWNYVSANN